MAKAHSASDAFGRAAAPETYSIDPPPDARARLAFSLGTPRVLHLPMAAAPAEVHHRALRARGPRGPLAGRLVALLQARAFDDALEIAQELLDDLPANDPRRAPVERAIALAVGRERLSGRWGSDPVADWLRARLVDATGQGQGWLGILGWLGRHAGHRPAPSTTLDALPLAAAAIAVARGPARALSEVWAALRQARKTEEGAGLVRALILRCALEGAFVAEALRKVVPSPRRGGDLVAPAWKPLVLARRALRDGGHVVGAAHLTAALVATDVRRRFLDHLRFHGLHARIPSWGSRALSEKEAGDLHAAIHDREVRTFALQDVLPSPPWPAEWGGPDTREVTAAVARLLGGDVRLAREAFMHDGLALAAVHALGGHAVNALAVLGASRTPPALDEARTALAQAIHGGIAASTLPADLPAGPEAEAAYRRLRRLPEPSLALETPYWLLGAQRAEAQHALQTSGRLQQFRDLRLLLDRPDVAAALAPFWLLREEPGLEGSLIDLVRDAAAGREPPAPDQCLRFLRSLE